MSEDKMKADFDRWIFDPSSEGYPLRHTNAAWYSWKACAAIKDAEIADLKTRLSGRTCFIPPEFQKQLDDAHAEIASRDLMIKELREAFTEIASYKDKPLTGIIAIALRAIAKHALAKSEHHNSRALEIKLLEARIDEIKRLSCWHPLDGNWEEFVRSQAQDYEIVLAELNKE